MPRMNGVSLVICCHNSRQRLAETLAHVARQRTARHTPWELIIIDNASTDHTYELAGQLTEEAPYERKIFKENSAGLTYARMRGIAEARYEYISFVDDDNQICEAWVELCHEIMSKDPSIGACGGPSEAAFESTPPAWFDTFQQNYAVGPQGERSGYVPDSRGFLWGAGLTIRRSAWMQVCERGFELLMPDRRGQKLSSGGDAELCYALRLLGWRLWYDERLRLKHYITTNRLDWGYLRKLMRACGRASVPLELYRKLVQLPGGDNEYNRHYMFREMKRLGSILFHCNLILPFFIAGEGYRKSLQSEYYIGCILELLAGFLQPAAAQRQYNRAKRLTGIHALERDRR